MSYDASNVYTTASGSTTAFPGQVIASATWNSIFTDIATNGLTVVGAALSRAGKIYCTATGTNAITLTLANSFPAIPSYANGQTFTAAAAATSNGAVTLRVGALAFLKVFQANGTTQAGSGDIVNGQYYEFVYLASLDGAAGGFITGGGSSSIFVDTSFRVVDDGDPTKRLAFQVSGVTTGTTRTMTVPDASGTFALLEAANVFTIGQNVTLSTNSSLSITITNSNAGTSALASHGVSNGTSTGGFGIGGINNTVLSSILQGRVFIDAGTGAAGIVINNEGNNPTIISRSNAELARFPVSGTSILNLGVTGTLTGSLGFSGVTSGTATITAQAAAGTPTLTLPNASGTFAVTASAPLSLSATTGALTLPGTAGQVLAGATPAFTATPTLGAVGTLGTLSLSGNTSGTVTIQPQAAAGTYNFNLPTAAGTAGQPLLSGGGGAAAQTYGTLAEAAGGTNNTTYTVGDILYSAVTNTLSKRAAVATGAVFASAGVATAPVWSTTPNISGSLTIGQNTTVPSGVIFQVSNNTQNLVVGIAGTIFQIANTSGSATRGVIDVYRNGNAVNGSLSFRSMNGTPSSPTATASGNILGAFFFEGAMTASTFNASSVVFATATEAWSAGVAGSSITVNTTQNGGVTTNNYVFGQDGGFSIGTTTAAGLGQLRINSATFLIRNSTAFTNGAGVGAGTLGNAPAAGNPTKWIAIDDNGTTRQIPAW